MQKIIPCLWFDAEAEDAANFYVAVFTGGKIGDVTHYSEAGHEIHGQPKGKVMTVEFEIEGFSFLGLNGGPLFKINPSISFFVACKNQEEVDDLWGKLSKGGEALMPLQAYPFSERYGWCKDKFGVSWQIMFMGDRDFSQKIIPSLMFVGNVCGKAEEAMNFYLSVFRNSKTGNITRYGKRQEPDNENSIAHANLFLEGVEFAIMESAHEHKFGFTEAVSLIVQCNTQQDIDYYWEKLSAVPASEQCGWLKDKFGVCWQIVPTNIKELIKSDQAMKALLEMGKIDIAQLKS